MNLCAPIEEQMCLLMAVPPHQVTQGSVVPPMDVSALLTVDRAAQLVMNPPGSKLNGCLESQNHLAKAKAVTTRPDSSCCWVPAPAVAQSDSS